MPAKGEGSYVCKLSPELQEKAKKELNEDPSRRQKDIEAIREWINKQPYIKGKTDDEFILRFLRSCKFSLERTKEKIDRYYTIKSALPEWFQNLDPALPEHQQVLDAGWYLPLRGYDREGRRVIITRMGAWNPSKMSLEAAFRVNAMIHEIVLEDEQTQICGIIALHDMKGMSGSHIANFTPTMAKKSIACLQDCIPLRMQGINILNLPSVFETLVNLFKGFMKTKLKDRVHVLGSKIDSIYDRIPKEILPEEYGGTAGPIRDLAEYWKQEVTKHRQKFLDDEIYKTDEAKRPGKPKTSAELFGVEGSFRKLEID